MGEKDDPVIAYWKWLMTLPMPFQWPWDDFQQRSQDRQRTHYLFPYIVTIEASTEELRSMENWCWSEFGPKDGQCSNEGCWHSEGSVEYIDSPILTGLSLDDWQPVNSGLHKHTGEWTSVWALKTSYVDGFCDFCFKKSDQAVYFKFNFGFDL